MTATMKQSHILPMMCLLGALCLREPLLAQIRVTPKESKGGEQQGQPWAEVPESFRQLKIPDWPLPTDMKRWQEIDRPNTRDVLAGLLGEMPRRPNPAQVKVVSKEDHDGYILERFQFHNGVDNVVPGILLIPKK